MIRSLRNLLLLAPLLAVLVACSSGSSGPPPNVFAARQSLPIYPASEARGAGKAPPGIYQVDHPKDFAADATYFVGISGLENTIQQYYQAELTKAGWTADNAPVPSHDSQLASYCRSPEDICKSYTKDKVRAIIITIIVLDFGGGGREGSPYHIHVEEQ